MTRLKRNKEGKIIYKSASGGEIYCTYYPNGMIETRRVLTYDTKSESYKEYDLYNRVTKNIEKINGKIVTDLTTEYRFYKGIWFYKRHGIYNGRNIVLNGVQERGGAV